MASFRAVLFTALVLLFALIAHHLKSRLSQPKKPPGPPGWPVLGNVLDNPTSEKHKTFKAWGDKYGPIIKYSLMTQEIIVLNERNTAYELLERRSSTSQDRPRQVMCGELISWNRGIALCHAGPRHRTYRKLVNSVLSVNATKSLWPVQERAAHVFVQNLLKQCCTPSAKDVENFTFLEILRRSIGMNVAGIIFGADLAPEGSTGQGMTEKDVLDYIHAADVAHALFGKALAPFAYMVDWLPWLTYVPESFPFVHFKREARLAREDLENLTMKPFNKTLERIKSGNSQNCYVDLCLGNNPNPTSEELSNIAWTAMSAYTGGSDTTIGMVTTFFLAASLHPEAQKLAQAELEQVIGPNRMPLLSDQLQLPYVSAFVQECLRSCPAVPVGVAHRAMKNEVINGYFIAKGSTLIANIWGILHDSSVYSSPFSFNPLRFIPATGTPTNPALSGLAEPLIGSLPFGFGRRICPGMHLADSAIWIYVASVLWAFNISPKNLKHEDFSKAWLEAKFSEGALLHPMHFSVDLKPRFSSIHLLSQSK
ncbi:cytochrome P450 [Lentinula edodes]|uniref:Cytochrome P450 n=1 Tax=Lentinula lateritia TaxID=40482 RepID=A0A9W9A090_9AGAR|nr:cytochrome P450 [Lentinula edodes]